MKPRVAVAIGAIVLALAAALGSILFAPGRNGVPNGQDPVGPDLSGIPPAIEQALGQGDVAAAERIVSEVASKHPDEPVTQWAWGRVLAAQGRWAEAAQAYAAAAQRAGATGPMHIEARVGRADALLALVLEEDLWPLPYQESGRLVDLAVWTRSHRARSRIEELRAALSQAYLAAEIESPERSWIQGITALLDEHEVRAALLVGEVTEFAPVEILHLLNSRSDALSWLVRGHFDLVRFSIPAAKGELEGATRDPALARAAARRLAIVRSLQGDAEGARRWAGDDPLAQALALYLAGNPRAAAERLAGATDAGALMLRALALDAAGDPSVGDAFAVAAEAGYDPARAFLEEGAGDLRWPGPARRRVERAIAGDDPAAIWESYHAFHRTEDAPDPAWPWDAAQAQSWLARLETDPNADDARVRLARAGFLISLDHPHEALPFLHAEMRRLEEPGPPDRRRESAVYYWLSTAEADAGQNPEEALRLHQEALSRDPGLRPGHLFYARLLRYYGDWEDAFARVQALVATEPVRAGAYAIRGEMTEGIGEWEAARDDAIRLVLLGDPAGPPLLARYAVARDVDASDWERLLADLPNGARIGDGRRRLEEATTLGAQEPVDWAAQRDRAAAWLDEHPDAPAPDHAKALADRVEALAWLDDTEGALRDVEASLALVRTPDALALRGLLALRAGNPILAAGYADEGLRAQDGHPMLLAIFAVGTDEQFSAVAHGAMYLRAVQDRGGMRAVWPELDLSAIRRAAGW